MPTYPRFIVNSMLGHVARWLRLLGYDTLYFKRIEDWKLVKLASEEDRVLITRDAALYRRARKEGVRALLIEDTDIQSVLAALSLRYEVKLDFSKDDTRCPLCNTPLKRTTSLVEVAGKVDKRVTLNYKEFWVCPKCNKVYWQGKHWRTITTVLMEAKEKKYKLLSKIKPMEKTVARSGEEHGG